MMTLMGTILSPREAFCRLSGEADLTYSNFNSRNNSGRVSGDTFSQRYSVLYEANGKFVNGRLGKYNVSLGYEWLTFDTDIRSGAASAGYGKSSGNLVYNADMVIDPKELPFKLTLYSRDMNRGMFAVDEPIPGLSSNDQARSIAAFSGADSPFGLPSGIATNIISGTHIDRGATLRAGVKNGMTNGYNEFLRHFPMLLLDYRDLVNKDTSGSYPVDNRFTRLAFVSLNKKENWFHYRYVTYDDYLDSSNNYNESQFQLGTVDHTLQRRWIDFTNWLTVSVDGQLTQHMDKRNNSNYEEVSLNLFGIARRESWELRSFNNFTRLNDFSRIIYQTSLPVYVNGDISPAASWSAYAKYNNNHTSGGDSFTSAAGGYTVDLLKRSRFTLFQGLNVEKVSTSSAVESLVTSGNIGTKSTPLFSRNLLLDITYRINDYRNDAGFNSAHFTGHELSENARYSLTNSLRLKFGQLNRITYGTSLDVDPLVPGSQVSSNQYYSPRDGAKVGSSYQSVTDFAVSWTPKPRLTATFDASNDLYVQASGERDLVNKARAAVNYSDSKVKTASSISYSSGSKSGAGGVDQLDIDSEARYSFSRSLEAGVSISYSKTFNTDNATDLLGAEQNINYSYYQSNGFSRKLFEINESFSSSEEFTNVADSLKKVVGTKRRTNLFVLGAKYFPLRNMMIAGGGKYYFVNGYENTTLSYYGSISLQFKLLEAGLDYTYGKVKSDNRVEKRFMANLKKKF